MQLTVHRPSEASALVTLAVQRMAATADPELKAALLAGFDDALARIAGTAVGPLEELLCMDVAASWLELAKLRAAHAKIDVALPLHQAGYWIRALDSAQLRFLRSVETLTRVRKMAIETGA